MAEQGLVPQASRKPSGHWVVKDCIEVDTWIETAGKKRGPLAPVASHDAVARLARSTRRLNKRMLALYNQLSPRREPIPAQAIESFKKIEQSLELMLDYHNEVCAQAADMLESCVRAGRTCE